MTTSYIFEECFLTLSITEGYINSFFVYISNSLLLSYLFLTHPVHVLHPLLQQWRLIPFLAAVYALEHFTRSFSMNFVEFQIGLLMKDKSDRQV